MRTGVTLFITQADVDRLDALVKDRNAQQKHVWREQIVRLSAEGIGTNSIMRETGKAKTCGWHRQERFTAQSADGLWNDKTQPYCIPNSALACGRAVEHIIKPPPGETAHWKSAVMAKAVGFSVSFVQRIWRVNRLQPHRLRQFEHARRHDNRANMQGHRHQEFIRFFTAVERKVPIRKDFHLILYNFAAH